MSVAKPQRPGKSFGEMFLLTLKNHRQPNPFTHQLMLGIFWEETLFTNRAQIGGGPGVGFGQVEHQNLFFLTQPRASQFNYFVPGVSSHTTQLDDDRAVQVSSCYLLHLFHHPDSEGKDKRTFALEGYGGVRNAAGTSLTPAERQAKIRGWKACELHLQMLGLSSMNNLLGGAFTVHELEDQIIAALKKAKPFKPEIKFVEKDGSTVTFRELLFPRFWAVPPGFKQLVRTFLPPGMFLQFGSFGNQVSLLQQILNAQSTPPRPELVADGIFGSKTQVAVAGFQKNQSLVADGIVGPKTRGKLVS
jgi:Putative peptidoglycan binding domain